MGRRADPHGGPTKWGWAWCPGSTEPDTHPGPCQTLEAISPDLSLLATRCSEEAVAFAELELATCAEGSHYNLLRRPETLKIHVPKVDKAIARLRGKHGRGPLQGESIGGSSSATSPDGRVRSGNQSEDVLLVSADRPETGKSRHSPLYNHWIRLKGQQLWIEPIPGESCCAPPTEPFVLARWTGAAFETTRSGWVRLLRLQNLYESRVDD